MAKYVVRPYDFERKTFVTVYEGNNLLKYLYHALLNALEGPPGAQNVYTKYHHKSYVAKAEPYVPPRD